MGKRSAQRPAGWPATGLRCRSTYAWRKPVPGDRSNPGLIEAVAGCGLATGERDCTARGPRRGQAGAPRSVAVLYLLAGQVLRPEARALLAGARTTRIASSPCHSGRLELVPCKSLCCSTSSIPVYHILVHRPLAYDYRASMTVGKACEHTSTLLHSDDCDRGPLLLRRLLGTKSRSPVCHTLIRKAAGG